MALTKTLRPPPTYLMDDPLVVQIVSFDTVGLRLLTFRTLEPYTSKDIAYDLRHVISH